MDATLHAPPPARRRTARLMPSARIVAVLAAGIGIGLVAALPFGDGIGLLAVLAIVAASVVAAVVAFRPWSPAAIVVADVLLGIAVIATVFGRLGLLYVPLMLAFLVVTARIEKTAEPGARSDGLTWEPAPEFEAAMPAAVAAPMEPEPALVRVHQAPIVEPEPVVKVEPVVELEPVVVHIDEAAGVEAEPVAEDEAVAELEPIAEMEPLIVRIEEEALVEAKSTIVVVREAAAADGPTPRHSGRHRAPSSVRRAAAAAARASRRLGTSARSGIGNLRTAIVTERTDVEPPDPADEADENAIDQPPAPPPPPHELDMLRHRFEERELDLVAAGKGWSGLHRAYGELRYLPPPETPPPRKLVAETGEAKWEPPVWKNIGDE